MEGRGRVGEKMREGRSRKRRQVEGRGRVGRDGKRRGEGGDKVNVVEEGHVLYKYV